MSARPNPRLTVLLLGLLAGCGGRSVPRDPVPLDGGLEDSGPVVDGGVDGGVRPDSGWQGLEFVTAGTPRTGCNGDRHVAFNAAYALWVGAESCNANRYKLYLAGDRNGPYFPIGDAVGGGEDHCELVNAAFRISNETDVKSQCSACAIGPTFRIGGASGFTRRRFGEAFNFSGNFPSGTNTNDWLECAVTIP